MYKFLYNGIPLPALPNEVLAQPNIFIGNTDNTAVAIGFSGTPQTWKTANVPFVGSKEEGSKIRAIITSDGTGWEIVETVDNTTFSYPLAKVSWSNYDILNTDGTLYLAASDPIPVLEIQIPKGVDRYSYIVGFNLALAGMAYPYSAPTPTAYLYNGIRLPALPEWDRGVYPYAFVTWTKSSSSATAFLYCSTVPIYKNDETSLFAYVIAKENGSMICYACTTWPDGEIFEDWHRFEDGDKAVTAETKFTVLQTGAIKWANHDMLNYSDDSVYLAKSEPVPVYE